jgi:hypothetical protein
LTPGAASAAAVASPFIRQTPRLTPTPIATATVSQTTTAFLELVTAILLSRLTKRCSVEMKQR